MEKILINIDSRQRDYNLYPSSSFFRVGADSQPNSNFANLINFKNIDYIKLASAEIPNNFYIFHDTRFNNYFKLKLTLNDGATPNPNLNAFITYSSYI